MGFRIFVVVTASLWLCGCAVVRDYVADLHQESATAFCQMKSSNPSVKTLVGKLPIVGADEITPKMLTLDQVPSDEDVAAIIVLSEDQHACRDHLDAVTKEHWPTQTAMRKGLALKNDLVTAQLIRRKLTFGNANRLYQEASLEAEGQLTEDRREQIEKSREQDALAWRTLSDGIRAIAGTQKPEPSQDPCTWAGNTIDCGGR